MRDFDPWFGPDFRDPKRTRAYRLFDHNQYSRDIRGLAPEIFGHELRDPHADRRLLEFALSVPEQMYRRDGISRSFARRVLADRLPHVILDERRHAPTRRPGSARSMRGAMTSPPTSERLEASPLARSG